MLRDARRVAPGVVALGIGTLLVRELSSFAGVNETLLAIGVGVLLTNTVGVSDRLQPGVETHNRWLVAGIVLLGASLTLGAILETGKAVLLLVAVAVTVTVLSVELLGRNVAGLSDRLGSLLAAGAGICGVSAVVAVGGAVRAREVDIAYAAGTVLLLDAISIVVYPAVGSLLDLSGTAFGVWAGVSMLSTGPVVAVGFAHSEVAGQWATITKLARNALIGAVAVGYASYYASRDAEGSASLRLVWDTFPKFILGFLAFVVLASAGVLSPDLQLTIERAVDWLFLVAFLGLGTEIRLADIRRTGVTPVLVVFTVVAGVSVLSLAIVSAVL